jgi:hypothetical protein
MNKFNWCWTKFLIGFAVDKTPNLQLKPVWVFAIHLGFATIILSPQWENAT